MKTCIVAIGRYEGDYVEEWVNYHLNLGFDHIYLGDNNFDNPERMEVILNKYIKDGKVSVYDCRNEFYHVAGQCKFYMQMYRNEELSQYDWILYIDIDEFFTLSDKFKNVHEYLSQDHFKDFDVIKINWKVMTDSGRLFQTNEPVLERFTIPMNNYVPDPASKLVNCPTPERKNATIKSFIRPNLAKDFIMDPHTIITNEKQLRYCNNVGELQIKKFPADYELYSIYTREINHKDAYIRHFQTKTVEEYVKYKMKRGWNCYAEHYDLILSDVLNKSMFFAINGYNELTDQLFDEFVKRYQIQYKGDFTFDWEKYGKNN
jgi:hypothetical protein